ncbi:MAG: hypothetical protein WA719_07135 [Thermoplasmata archaeon]
MTAEGGGGVPGNSGRNPGLDATMFQTEELVGWNRGRVRGWALLGAVVAALAANFSWPDEPAVRVCVGTAAVFVWIETLTTGRLRTRTEEARGELDGAEPRDMTTGGRD